MDSSSIIKQLTSYALPLVVGVVGLAFVIYGAFSISSPKQTSSHEFTSQQELAEAVKKRPTSTPKQITVDVEGSVVKPGVYTLSDGSRTQAALSVAGGFAKDADRQYVAQNINLAAVLTDGAQIYIPAVGEQMTTSGTSSNTTSGNVAGAATKTISINQATASDLEALPGIGPVTAQKIIDNRPYKNVQELLDKKAVGESVFEKIKEQVSVY